MLDVQRNRGAVYQEEVQFTRKVMWGHMLFGALVTTMFLFHELFWWFGASMAWYTVSLVVMYGFMSERQGFRLLLAVTFLTGAMAGLYFINRVLPGVVAPRRPLLPQAFIPIWIGLANLIYGFGTLLVLFNGKIRRAGSVGFTLW
ncbi:MAG: hypothetical protein JNM65_18075 [Verrucomicrobiaceae bacterium]|nr:hypothetical protein [Verrucomicrobiaceae bacterium]